MIRAIIRCPGFGSRDVAAFPSAHFPPPISSQPTNYQSMGCCCNEEEELLLQPLNSPKLHDPSSSTPHAAADDSRPPRFLTTISPMNSNFSALLCTDTLRSILEKMSLLDLARAACVCRLWNIVASDKEMQIRAFKSPWKIDDVIGNPSSGSFWRDNSISKFAISHRVRRGDTVAGLAVRYSVQVVDIKRLNNMMSDHGIYSRERLLIPVNKPELLVNATCYIELDTCAKREVAILYLEGAPDVKATTNLMNRMTTERTKRRLIDSLRRSMHVDDGTAQYYLSVSNGDPRAALSQFSDDLSWERQVSLA